MPYYMYHRRRAVPTMHVLVFNNNTLNAEYIIT